MDPNSSLAGAQYPTYGMLGGPPRLSLDGLSGKQLAEIQGGLKDVLGYRLYDTYRIVKDTALPLTTVRFFSTPLGNQQKILNGTTQYTKSELDTNMEAAGQLPRGQEMVVHSIQFDCLVPGAEDTTVASTGDNVGLTTGPTPAAASASVQNIRAILQSGFIEFQVGDKTYERGPFRLFPSKYGISGFAGAGSDVNNESVANNGFGRCYVLPVPRTMDAGRRFSINATIQVPVVPTTDFILQVILEGILLRSVQ